jgi:porphobilinogen synthase
MAFPIHRMRRLRATAALRNLVRETRLEPGQLVLPLFVCPGEGVRREIGAMPGNYQLSVDELVKECAGAASLGVGGVILFGIPETKDEIASGAYAGTASCSGRCAPSRLRSAGWWSSPTSATASTPATATAARS